MLNVFSTLLSITHSVLIVSNCR